MIMILQGEAKECTKPKHQKATVLLLCHWAPLF